jgi:hypothetical protein
MAARLEEFDEEFKKTDAYKWTIDASRTLAAELDETERKIQLDYFIDAPILNE